MSPFERNTLLGITDHETRRLRGDLIYTYKMFESGLFTPAANFRTRGHNKKLRLELTTNNLRKHSFGVRNVAAWNALPTHVVNSANLDTFKRHLDEYLCNVTDQ